MFFFVKLFDQKSKIKLHMKKLTILFLLLIAASHLNIFAQTDGTGDFNFLSLEEEIRDLNSRARSLPDNRAAEKLRLAQDAYMKADAEDLNLGRAEALATMGIAYFHLQEIDKSLENLNMSYEISGLFDFTDVRIFSSQKLGLVQRYLDDNEKALLYFQEGSELAGDEKSERKIYLMSELARTYRDLVRYEDASLVIDEAYSMADELGEQGLSLELTLLAGDIQYRDGQIREAVNSLLEIVKKTSNIGPYDKVRTSAMSLLGRSYAALSDYSRALSYGQDALLLSVRSDSPEGRLDAYETLSYIYELMGDYREAFEHLRLFYEQKEILEKGKNSENLNSIKTYYETFEKEKEIGEQQIRIESQNRMIIAGALMLVSLAALLLIFYLLYKKNSRIAEKLSRDLKREMVLSKTDPVTGLPNRKDMDERLHKAVNLWKQTFNDFSLIMISFSDHRKIDRDMGEGSGEKFQKFIGQILKSELKGHDSIALWKPFVFTILLPDTDEKSLGSVRHRLSVVLSDENFVVQEITIPLSFSMGGCTYSGEGNRNDCIDKCKEEMNQAST